MISRRKIFLAAALAAFTSPLALGHPAHAEVVRYALLVGSNQGQPHEAALAYAESDVHAVADTLMQLGGFASEHIVRLTRPTATRARAALVDLNLAIQQQTRRGGEAILFVYYSGHADAQNLHLGDSQLLTEEFSKLVRLSPAKLKILLLDACRAGALTRVKGGRQVAPFQIDLHDQLRNEGYAIITSSAAGEDAQESDALRSSIFTHHFLSALRGPGDTNQDGLVTLGEAYAYAYERSLKTSISTIVGSQHATFDYDMRGRADPVLADLRAVGNSARLVLATGGEYLVMSAQTDAVIAEATVGTAKIALLLPPGTVRVRMRNHASIYQAALSLQAGQSTTLAADSMQAVPLAQVVRKGQGDLTWTHGPTVAGSIHGALAAGLSPMMGAQVGWAIDLPRITVIPRLGFATSSAHQLPGNVARHSLDEFSLDIAALYVIDWGRLSVAPLASVGWGLYRQIIDLPDRQITHPQAFITSIGGWASWPLGRGFTMEASAELVNFYMRRQSCNQGIEADAPRFGTATYRGNLGASYRY